MKNYQTLFLLCCMALFATSYSVSTTTEKVTKGNLNTKNLVLANTVTINLNNSTGTVLPSSGVYLKQSGNIVMTLYYPTAPGVNFYTSIPAGTYEVEGFFSGSNSSQYLYGLPFKGPKCSGPESNFGTYNLIDSDHLSLICILASSVGNYPFCSSN
ncbi:hypothetical protein ACFX5U_07010 [Sphingobacterium sp. SG20118]|uniref:hypothetical protein n=1 Tax=Sphingobacterium sp. SG20118 TaxID=3367156 RepID=UPI0037DFC770